MTNVKIQKAIAILISLMTMCALFNLISENAVPVSAGWSSVAELENYALANWTKPIQASYADINTGSRYFGANRTGTTRKHAANDYVCAVGTSVYAMTGGYVEEFSSNFYGGTQAISVKNDDGSVARYCEIKTSFRSGDRVEKGQQIGTVIANNKGGGHMLHLEMYLGTASGSLTNTSNSTYWYVSYKNYCRRQDLINPSFTQKLGVVDTCTCNDSYAGNYLVVTDSSNLNIRSGESTSASIVGKIPKGTTVHVSKGNGTWLYVENYNGISGHVYASYMQKLDIDPPTPQGQEISNGAGQTLPDGDYYIISSINMNYYVDIPGTEVASGNNVNMYTMETNVMPPACDAWTLVYLGNGFYEIKSKGTNFCLDVSGASLDRGTNVQVWEENDSTAQQWSIIQTDYGYKIQSRCNGFYLDIAGGGFENSTNVQVWETNDTTAQKYVFVPYGASTGQTIEDGVYSIRSALDAKYCVDADGAAVKSEYKDETNIHLWETNTCDDLFYVEYLSDGYYNVSEVSTGLALDIWSDDANFTYVNRNIQLCGKNGNRNQQWVIKDNGDGTYTLISKMSGYCLDLSGGVCEKGKNISQYYYNGTAAQKWSFVPVSPSEITIVSLPNITEYYIGSNLDTDGAVIQAKYEIGTFKDITYDVSYAYNFSKPGKTNVFVKYNINGVTLKDAFNVTIKEAPFDGNGTENNPYLISSKEDLKMMRDLINNEDSSAAFRNCTYLQTIDIDLENEKWTPIGKRDFDEIATERLFAGHYNGNCHTISGLYVNETTKYAGLFGSIGTEPAIIENLAVEGTVNSTDISVGGICGEICGKNGIIRNCSFIGNVSGGEQAVGGVVGYIWQSGSVIDCYHNGTVTSNGGRIIGGVVGNIHTGGSEDSNTVLIQNCYHVGTLSGASDAAGTIAGIVSVDTQHESIITIENCYALQGEGNAIGSGKANTQDITLLKSALMKAAASSLGSAYKENTDSSFNGGYPIFNWQNSVVGDCNNDGVFTIADIVMVQKWLLNDGTVLDNWKAADLYGDNVINVFDLVLMKQMIVNIK